MYYSQLRAFHAVAQHGGFSKAANKLNLTQPAISDQVRKLEDLFDVVLFDRRKRAVRPTELGERLFEITRRMFDIEGQAIELLTESRALKVGHINIAADSPVYAARLIGAFRQKHPGITVSLHVCNSEAALQALFDYDADAAVISPEPIDDRLLRITLSVDSIIAFVHPGNPLARNTSIDLQELSRAPVILRETGSHTRRTIEEEAARIGIRINVVMEADSREAIREAAFAGVGVGVLSKPEFGDDKRLSVLSINGCERQMPESLVCLKDRARHRLVDAFWTVGKEFVGLDAHAQGR